MPTRLLDLSPIPLRSCRALALTFARTPPSTQPFCTSTMPTLKPEPYAAAQAPPFPARAAPGQPSRFATGLSPVTWGESQRGQDVWSLFSPLAFPDAVNLGQGFMSFGPSQLAADALVDAARPDSGAHQYPPPKGRVDLRQRLAERYTPTVQPPADADNDKRAAATAVLAGQDPVKRASASARALDPETEVLVTAGANEGMYAACVALLEAGDEVVLLEPFFDQYVPQALFSHATPVFVPFTPAPSGTPTAPASANDWTLDWAALEAAFARPRAKMLMFNSPHNPIGKVFTTAELQRLAHLAIKYDIVVLADEVYDSLVFDGQAHVPLAAIEGMWERTLTVGSAGKTFAATGWRVGWVVGAPALVRATLLAQTRIVFCVSAPAQAAVAAAFARDAGRASAAFLATQLDEYTARRERLLGVLRRLGIPHWVPAGAYFVVADLSNVHPPAGWAAPAHVPPAFGPAWFVATTTGVVGIPVTAFTRPGDGSMGSVPAADLSKFIRLSFCKRDDEFAEAEKRLEKLKPFIRD